MSTEELSPHRRRRRLLGAEEPPDFTVKSEPEEDIKDYAETTMNELLGWYGYEKVDSRDTQGLNLTHFAPAAEPPSPPSSDLSQDTTHPTPAPESPPTPDASSDEMARQQQQMVSALSTVTKRPDSPSLPPGYIVCAWCQKVGVKLFTLRTTGGCKAFCSELCFTQCRRASFKKNKVCDWCKHVRHTVSYVDFRDGEQRLQFCSDKCLNQYKMNLFCRETRAHLRLHHSHLQSPACAGAGAGSLITPELWMRDCDIENPSDDNMSPAHSPVSPKEPKEEDVPAPKKEKSPKKNLTKHSSKKHNNQTKPKKANGQAHHLDTPSRSPVQVSPPANRQVSNGSLLSPPPMHKHPPSSAIPRPAPPVPSTLGVGNLDHVRPPFLPPNMIPPPFQFLAQQQMEAIFRSQHGMDIRAKMPPPFPLPPWVTPPFPQIPQPHHPLPPMNSKSPSAPQMSPQSRSHHHNSTHKSNHHIKHKSHKQTSSNENPSFVKNIDHTIENNSPFRNALPPVTVMIPFPLVLPIPLPIPVPIPIPPEIMDRVKSRDKPKAPKEPCDNNKSNVEMNNVPKRKHSNELAKDRKRRKSSDASDTFPSIRHSDVNIGQTPKFYDRIEKFVHRSIDANSSDFSRVSESKKYSKSSLDAESRSYSPISEAISSNEEDNPRTLQSSESDVLSSINFSGYNLSVMRSSPSYAAGQLLLKDNMEDYRSPSPANLSLKDKLEIESSSVVNFKKKHLRDQFSLVA